MGVVFAPQEPLDTGVSYGIGQQHRQDQLYQQQLAKTQQDQHQQQIDQRQYEYANEPYRQQQDMQARLAYEASHAQQEFTINDQLQLQRLQNDRQSIDAAVTSGQLLPEDAKQMYADLATPISVYQRRQEMTKQKMEQAQTEKALHDVARQKAVEEANLKRDAMTAQERVQPVYLPGEGPNDPGEDGQPLGAKAKPHAHVVFDTDANGRSRVQYHEIKQEKATADEPAVLNYPEGHPQAGQRVPGLYQKKPDGTLHLVPGTDKAEKPPATVLGIATRSGLTSAEAIKMVTEEEKSMIKTDAEGHSEKVGGGRTFTDSQGNQAGTTPLTMWHQMPHHELHAEAQRRVLRRLTGGDPTGVLPGAPQAAATPSGVAAPAMPSADAPLAQAAPAAAFTPDDAKELARLKARKLQLANQRQGVAPRPDPGFGFGGYGG